jgi:hypothetical protein
MVAASLRLACEAQEVEIVNPVAFDREAGDAFERLDITIMGDARPAAFAESEIIHLCCSTHSFSRSIAAVSQRQQQRIGRLPSLSRKVSIGSPQCGQRSLAGPRCRGALAQTSATFFQSRTDVVDRLLRDRIDACHMKTGVHKTAGGAAGAAVEIQSF